jgi:hypothetical protein
LVLKLETALKEKESIKLKFDNLRKKNADDAIAKDPMQVGKETTGNTGSNNLNP